MPASIERAVASLSPLEREMLVLSASERLHNSEIAARIESVERILARALRKFDSALGAD